MRARKAMRESYRCECSGPVPPGRRSAAETRGIRLAVFDWTGDAQGGCPWAPFRDPFVRRVLDAYRWFDSGQIATVEPHASHRLIEGIGYYDQKLSTCRSKAAELDREEAKKKRG